MSPLPLLLLLALTSTMHAHAATLYADIPGVIDVATPSVDQTTTAPFSEIQAGAPSEAGNVTIALSTEEDTADWSTVTLRLCYAPISQVDRKWRSTKDNVQGNTQCKQPGLKKIATIPWESGTNTLEYTFQPSQNVAEAIYFIEALVQNANETYVAKGFSGEKAFFQVIGWEAVDAGLITAAAVLSALSWASLGIYFIKDYLFTKKPTSMSGSPSFGLTTSSKTLA
ncbi:high affinity nitrate transporter [Pycnococcus provasolii]|uniref:High affinity nitrate transporter n=1 Tax=Pycnococcus provasolii TaxID=41880 RepID=A0A830HQ60_9CHLO|nr:high affinity nitrate transporter [Pycnococcus provasolii]